MAATMTPEQIMGRLGEGARGPFGIMRNYSKLKKESQASATPAASAISSSSGGGGGGGSFYGPYDEVLSGYRNFAQTGGFSPQDLASIRARSISPIRATYANAEREVNRQRALQGGYSPGFGVLKARMAREQGQAGAEATTSAEANIAEMVQQGKLAGLGGMAGLVGRESGGGGGGGDADTMPAPEKKKGFWGKLGGALKKVGQVALPIALGAIGGPGGMAAGKGISGAIGKIGASAGRQMGVR